jgi:DHA1 family tetracycline resistance protein-like MFS transporter
VGALVSPGAGWLGDRLGYARVLGWAAGLGGLAAVAMAVAPSITWLAVGALLLAAAFSATTAMCVALLATTTPPERRSGTLNLALVPLYLGGIVGPALGAAVAVAGVRAVFAAAAVPLAGGMVVMPRLRGRVDESKRPGGG